MRCTQRPFAIAVTAAAAAVEDVRCERAIVVIAVVVFA
jgi:hypothetical protein